MVKIKMCWLQKFIFPFFILLPFATINIISVYAAKTSSAPLNYMPLYGREKKPTPSTPSITVSENMISYGAMATIEGPISDTNLSSIFNDPKGTVVVKPTTAITEDIEKRNVSATTTYWEIQPEQDSRKNRHAIKNQSTVKIINLHTGQPLGISGAGITAGEGISEKNCLWAIKLEETLDPYWKSGHTFSLRHKQTGRYLSSSLEKNSSGNYSLVMQMEKTDNSLWKITNFHPAIIPQDLSSGTVVALLCLGNNKYLKGFPEVKVILEHKTRLRINDRVFLLNMFFPAGINPSETAAQFEILTSAEEGKLKFKSMSFKKLVQSIPPTEKTKKRFPLGFYKIWPTGGTLIAGIPTDIKWLKKHHQPSWEEFRIEDGFYIKNDAGGYLKLIGPISDYIKPLKATKYAFKRLKHPTQDIDFKGSNLDYRIVSAYDKVLDIEGGSPNTKNYDCAFAVKIIKGTPLLPIISEEEIERVEVYGEVVAEEGIHKLDTPQKGSYTWIGTTEKPGAVELTMSVKSVSSFFIGLTEKKVVLRPGDPVYEIVGGFGPTMIRKKHLGEVADPKDGNLEKTPLLTQEDWNDIWVKVVGGNVSVGTGSEPGKNTVNSWQDTSENPLEVTQIGISNWEDPAHFKIKEIRIPEIKPEEEVSLFVAKLEETRKTPSFKTRADQLITLMSEAIISDENRDAFIDELRWMVDNKKPEQLAEIQRVLNAAKWNTLLTNNDPTRIDRINDLAQEAGIKISYIAILENIEKQVNLSYTSPEINKYLEETKDSVMEQLKNLVTESIAEKAETRIRLLRLINSVTSHPIFKVYEEELTRMKEELEKPITTEGLLERIKSGSATTDRETKERFIKALEYVTKKTIEDIATKVAPEGAVSNLIYLLNVVRYSLEFDSNQKKIAEQLLTQMPKVEEVERVMVAPAQNAGFDEQIKYLVLMATTGTFRSPDNKRTYLITLGNTIAIPDLTAEQLKNLNYLITFIKQYPKLNDQDKAQLESIRLKIELLLKEATEADTIDNQVNALFQNVLTVDNTTSANKDFLEDVKEVVAIIKGYIDEGEKVPALTRLQNLPDMMKVLPNFKGSGEEIKKQIEEIKKDIDTLVEQEKKLPAKEEKKEEEKPKQVVPTRPPLPSRGVRAPRERMMPEQGTLPTRGRMPIPPR